MTNRTNKKRNRKSTPRVPYGIKSSFGIEPPIDEEVVQVIGNPFGDGQPVTRKARLEDCEDDCPACMMLREQILAGNPPTIMVFE